jgi:hypothetical protein
MIANTPDIIKYYIQQNNIHKKVAKSLVIQESGLDETSSIEIEQEKIEENTETTEVDKLLSNQP